MRCSSLSLELIATRLIFPNRLHICFIETNNNVETIQQKFSKESRVKLKHVSEAATVYEAQLEALKLTIIL